MKVSILHLYYDLLNLYGEYGNINILESRLKDQGIEVQVDKKTVGDDYSLNDYDFIYCGSGTESNLEIAIQDLQKQKDNLIKYINDGKYGLFTGNSIEMLGAKLYKMENGEPIDIAQTLGIFDFECGRLDDRKTGDVILNSKVFQKEVVGFVNKQSEIFNNKNPLFNVKLGPSDNIQSKTEGVYKNNFYSTYVIGPLLVRNPEVLKLITYGIIKKKDPNYEIKEINYNNEDDGYNLVLTELSSQIR